MPLVSSDSEGDDVGNAVSTAQAVQSGEKKRKVSC